MTAITEALDELRAREAADRAGLTAGLVRDELRESGVRFAAIGGPLQERWDQALRELERCIRPFFGSDLVLSEGGVYLGSWIESTGTINTEVLARFVPSVARQTHLLFATHQRDDGMIPYKVTDTGPGFSQIQIVTPLARGVWEFYLAGGRRDTDYLRTMYTAMSHFDEWLARYRDTRATGAVEAFCTFDTGHDLSPRFWFVPDRGYRGDARLYDPASPLLPYLAPDLTANVACQRTFLALIAEELGHNPEPWRLAAQSSLDALWRECYDESDGTFYDRDATGEFVRVQSDVLLRVLACEVGDDAFFQGALERYLFSTRKFLGHYGFTSLAMDDPRFDHDYTHNSWGGPSNFLSLIRAPRAFEHHGRVAELALATAPVLSAVAGFDRFPQCIDPWTGSPGFTELYSPAILWFLDAIERHAGILPRPDGEIWFTGLAPTRLDHGSAAAATGYARTIEGTDYELVCDDTQAMVFRDRERVLEFPRGWRVVTDAAGTPTTVIGVAAAAVSGTLVIGSEQQELTIAPNERVDLVAGRMTTRHTVGFTAPRS